MHPFIKRPPFADINPRIICVEIEINYFRPDLKDIHVYHCHLVFAAVVQEIAISNAFYFKNKYYMNVAD